MSDLHKVCDKIREKYGLKSFSVGVDYENNIINVYTSDHRAFQQFEFSGFMVDFITENKIEKVEALGLQEVSSVEEIDDKEGLDFTSEEETSDISSFELSKEDWTNEDFNIEDIDFDKI